MARQKKTNPKNKGGRPSDYTTEKADLICKIISTTTWGLPKICSYFKSVYDIPCESVVREWRLNHEEFATKYARAKLAQADILAEECLDISDNSTPEDYNVNRLRIDTRKWLASKLLPRQYGDKSLLEQKTEENDKLKEELRELRANLDATNRREF
jgi:hypothetical protein